MVKNMMQDSLEFFTLDSVDDYCHGPEASVESMEHRIESNKASGKAYDILQLYTIVVSGYAVFPPGEGW